MRDLKLHDLYRGLPPSLKGVMNDLRAGEVMELAERYIAYMSSIFCLISLPANITMNTAISEVAENLALYKVTGEIHCPPDKLQAHESDILSAYNELLPEVIKTRTLPENKDFYESKSVIDTIGLTKSNGTLNRGMVALLEAVVINSWTGFELFATDLWVLALNCGPEDWARKASRQKINGQTQSKSFTIEQLYNIGLDLRKSIGTLLKKSKKFDFNSYNGIMNAYSIFGRTCEGKFTGEMGRYTKALESTRNLLAHQAGKIDGKYIEEISTIFVKHNQDELFLSLSGKEDEYLLLDGKIVLCFIRASVELIQGLLKFIDNDMNKSAIKGDDGNQGVQNENG